MSPVHVAMVVFALTFGGAMLGMFIGARLPAHHASQPTRESVRLGMAMVATVSGLVLGLLVASAKSTYDTTDAQMKQVAANLVLLDGVLARYGPETRPVRAQLKAYVAQKADELWPGEAYATKRVNVREVTEESASLEVIQDQLIELSPTSGTQRQLKEKALKVASEIMRTRWLLIQENVGSSVPRALVVIVTFWLTVLFVSFGLFAPSNTTVVAGMLMCALSVATAILLVLEMSHPIEGLIQISSAPIRNALANMAR
jgi:hypothetical protein